MKTKLTFAIILSLGIGSTAFAQTGRVGINTTSPASTLDVVGKPAVAGAIDGIIAPRLTGDELKAKDGVYLGPQTGALVYATSAVTTPSGTKTAKVTSAGYYYFDGAVWQKVATPVNGADLTDDAWINDPTNASPQVKLGTKSDGTARATGADFVALDNGNVGIGLPAPTTKLEITSTGTNNPLKLNNLQTGANTDKLLTVDASGNVKQVSPAVGVVGLLTNSGNIIGTTQVIIPSGTISDLPGAFFTISPTVNVRVLITISAIGLPNDAGLPVQGSINLVQNGTIIASQYYSAADASAAVTQLGNFSTISRVVDLTPGTYTFKLSAKSWLNDTKFNGNAFPLYNGSIATDTLAQKSSIGYQVFTR